MLNKSVKALVYCAQHSMVWLIALDKVFHCRLAQCFCSVSGPDHESRASDYHPLHQVNFYSSTQIPCDNPEGVSARDGQFMVIHNQSFSIQFAGNTPVPTSRGVNLQGATIPVPPSYEEATKLAAASGGTVVLLKNGMLSLVPQPAGVSQTNKICSSS